MKLGIVSDVHLEFGDWYPINQESADVLILSGDIMVASDLYGTHRTERFLDFLDNCKNNYADVIYVMGNHEHYNGDFAESHKLLREACDSRGIHFLDNQSVKIGDVTFIGGTLWTDMNKEDSLTLYHMKSRMNDFRIVRNSNSVVHFKDEDGKHQTRVAKFSPEDAVEQHRKMLLYIRSVVAEKHGEKFVVVGHHAPSKLSTKPQYEHDTIMNGGYSSDLSEFILDHPQIKVWTHGHTHHFFDYMIGSTRIVCNPRGYVGYERAEDKVDPYVPFCVEV